MTLVSVRAERAQKIDEQRKIDRTEALHLKSRGMSNNAIAYQMNKSVSTIRNLLRLKEE